MNDVKKCFKCKLKKKRSLFYKHSRMGDGLLGKCKKCAKRDVRLNYFKNKGHYILYEKERNKRSIRKEQKKRYGVLRKKRYPGKVKANQVVSNAIRDKKLTRKPCEVCGTQERVQAHHRDYRRPLMINWLCFNHHKEWHLNHK